MITKETCYVGTCDNCGEIFNNGQYSMFPLESYVKDEMRNSEWYAEGTDKNHVGKFYCPHCFKYSETEDDVIIVDTTRFVEQNPEENMPHEYSNVKCDLCAHKWVAVRPEGVEKLECPNCSNICHFQNINPQSK